MAQRRRGRRLALRIVAGLLALLLAAVVGVYIYARPLLLTGTGYAAHNACALEFVAHRDQPATDLPPNPLVPYLSTTSNAAEGWVDSSVFGLLAKQRAWYTPGYGCTLAKDRPQLLEAAPVTEANPLTTATVAAGVPAGITGAIDHHFEQVFDYPNRLGDLGTRAVVVVHQGKVIAERYADGFDASTPQLGWSMAKSVTNLLVGVAVKEGWMSLDRGWGRDNPWMGDYRMQITLDHLLRMTSGLKWDETYDLGTPITRMLYLEPNMGRFAASQPLAHDVGTYQQYSSGSTNIACSILEDGSGTGGNLPRTKLFQPLGLTSAVWETDATGTPVCSSYLWATPREWAAIGQFALDDGVIDGKQLLPEGWMKESTTVTKVAGEEDGGYASGWWVNRRADGSLVVPDLPADAYWATGHDGQRLYIVPSEQLVVVRLGFSPGVPGNELGTTELVASIIAALI